MSQFVQWCTVESKVGRKFLSIRLKWFHDHGMRPPTAEYTPDFFYTDEEVRGEVAAARGQVAAPRLVPRRFPREVSCHMVSAHIDTLGTRIS